VAEQNRTASAMKITSILLRPYYKLRRPWTDHVKQFAYLVSHQRILPDEEQNENIQWLNGIDRKLPGLMT
jgi:hypothetical protein